MDKMQHINSESSLNDAIIQLKLKQVEEGKILRKKLELVHESIKPVNLIKNAFREISESREIKDNILNTAIGLGVGLVSKKILIHKSTNPLKRLLSAAFIFGITNVVANHPGVVKSAGQSIINFVRAKLASRHNKPGDFAA
jgi:hypothetical protein